MTTTKDLNDFPDELLLLILHFLPSKDLLQCSKVCQRWWRLSFDENLCIHSNFDGEFIPFKDLAEFIIQSPCIRTLSLRSATIIDQVSRDDDCFPEGFKANVLSLDLSMANCSWLCVNQLLERTGEKLEKLSLPFCGSLLTPYFDSVSDLIATFCPNLEYLSLHGSPYFGHRGEEGMMRLLTICKRLKYLNLTHTPLSKNTVRILAFYLSPSIQQLILWDVGDNFQDFHVEKIVKRCPKLTYLDIRGNFGLTMASKQAALTLKYLEKLEFGIGPEEEGFNDNYD